MNNGVLVCTKREKCSGPFTKYPHIQPEAPKTISAPDDVDEEQHEDHEEEDNETQGEGSQDDQEQNGSNVEADDTEHGSDDQANPENGSDKEDDAEATTWECGVCGNSWQISAGGATLGIPTCSRSNCEKMLCPPLAWEAYKGIHNKGCSILHPNKQAVVCSHRCHGPFVTYPHEDEKTTEGMSDDKGDSVDAGANESHEARESLGREIYLVPQVPYTLSFRSAPFCLYSASNYFGGALYIQLVHHTYI